MEVTQSVGGFLTPYAYESITVDNTVGGKGFTASNLVPSTTMANRDLGRARLVVATLETGSVRYTVHGTAPTLGAIGHVADPGAVFSFANYEAMRQFRAIRETATSGVLKVTFYR